MKSAKVKIISLVALAALLAGGLVYAKAAGSLNTSGVAYGSYTDPISQAVSNDDGSMTNIAATSNTPAYTPIDPGDDYHIAKQYDRWGSASSDDPSALQAPGVPCARYAKDVAQTTVSVSPDQQTLTVTLNNAYPFYYPTVFFELQNTHENIGTIAITTTNPYPSQLALSVGGVTQGETLNAGATAIGWVGIQVQEAASQGINYTFTVQITLTGTDSPNIALTKSASPTVFSAPGTVTYSYKVTNTGNVTLNPVTLTDDHVTGNITLGATSLAPGASTTGTKTYAITQAMIDAGSPITNTATASGTPPSGTAVTATATATVTIAQRPSIAVTKSASPTVFYAPGTVTYSYTVTNTGNVTLNPVTLNDNLAGTVSLGASSLAPGVSTTGTKTFAITPAMIIAGSSITNTATATGTPPSGPNVTATATATVTIAFPPPPPPPPPPTTTTTPPTTTTTTPPPTTTTTPPTTTTTPPTTTTTPPTTTTTPPTTTTTPPTTTTTPPLITTTIPPPTTTTPPPTTIIVPPITITITPTPAITTAPPTTTNATPPPTTANTPTTTVSSPPFVGLPQYWVLITLLSLMLIFLLILLIAYLSNRIWGKVIISSTGMVVPNAVVRLVDSDGREIKIYLTKDDGKYVFRRIKRGDYQLLVVSPLLNTQQLVSELDSIHWSGFGRIERILFIETIP